MVLHMLSRSLLSLPLILLISLFGACNRSADRKEPAHVLSTAREQMLVFNFNGPRDLLRASHSLFPEDSPAHAEYLYRLALSYWHATPPLEREVKEAALLFEKLGTTYPDSPFAPAAWLYLGRIRDIRDYAGDELDWEGARAAYETVIRKYPTSSEAGEAAVRYAMTLIKATPDKESMARGGAFLAEWLPQNEHRPEASPVAIFLAMFYDYTLPDSAAALRFYQTADRLGFVNQGRVGAYLWRMHTLAEAQGELENSIQYAQRIIRDYARSGRGYEALRSLERIRKEHPDREVIIPTLELFDPRKGDETTPESAEPRTEDAI
jgi:hypothetical protein